MIWANGVSQFYVSCYEQVSSGHWVGDSVVMMILVHHEAHWTGHAVTYTDYLTLTRALAG